MEGMGNFPVTLGAGVVCRHRCTDVAGIRDTKLRLFPWSLTLIFGVSTRVQGPLRASSYRDSSRRGGERHCVDGFPVDSVWMPTAIVRSLLGLGRETSSCPDRRLSVTQVAAVGASANGARRVQETPASLSHPRACSLWHAPSFLAEWSFTGFEYFSGWAAGVSPQHCLLISRPPQPSFLKSS